MRFSQLFIEEIRNRLRISEIIGRAIPIRKAGREYHALCPFHKEKTPSFTINDEKGFYHCFGCGAHGDVIGFTMDYEHLGYRESIERLASAAGLNIPQQTHAEVEREQKSQSLQEVIEAVTRWFQRQLEETSEGEIARAYLRERGLNTQSIATFRIGYAPADRNALERAMKQLGITPAHLVESGMLISFEDSAAYSRFRRRLIFPIRDRKSRVIALGGRVLPGDQNSDAPKYLNSPETALFSKGRQLFNIDLARRAAFDAKSLIICEGYMDVIALAQGGIAHAVAPLGTAITPEQLQLCWQLVDEPTLCLDGDTAGQRAMMRATELALPLLVPGKTLRVAVMPKGDDPDSLIRNAGRQAFDEVIAQAQPLASIIWNQTMGAPANTPESRAAQEESLMQKVGLIKHPTVQHYYRQHMRDMLTAARQAAYQTNRFQKHDRHASAGGNLKNYPAGAKISAFAGITSLPPLARTADTSLLVPASNLLALVIASPSLLTNAAAEEFWLHAPMPAPWQQAIHHLITELHIESPSLTSKFLWQTISEESPQESCTAINKAMEALGMDIASDNIQRDGLAQRMWGQVVNDVECCRLRSEIADAKTAYETDLTQANHERLTMLQGQLESRDRERSRFYREEPLTGNV